MKSRLLIGVVLLAALLGGAFVASRSGWFAPGPGEREKALFAARLPDIEGAEQSLEQYRGKVMVVNFWASWCPPCIEEIPGFTRLQERYRDRGLVIVGIAIDEPDAVRPFMEKLKVNYPVLTAEVVGYDLLRAAGDEKGVMPFTLVVGRDGRIVRSKGGIFRESELDQTLASLM